MKHQRLDLLFLCVCLALCAVLALGMLFAGPAAARANEVLASAPALRGADGLNTRFLSDVSTWLSDRFFLRQELITAHNRLLAALGGGESGDVIAGRKTLLDYSEKVGKVAKALMGRKIANPTPKPYYGHPSISDQQIIEKALRSKSGQKFSRLYSGDTTGYPSQSSADLALVSMIAFYTQDPSQIDHIFRTSGLFRDKWDSPRGDSTYGMMTIMTSGVKKEITLPVKI